MPIQEILNGMQIFHAQVQLVVKFVKQSFDLPKKEAARCYQGGNTLGEGMKPSADYSCCFRPVGRVAGFIELNKLSDITRLHYKSCRCSVHVLLLSGSEELGKVNLKPK